MKIIVVGATGTIGRAVVAELRARHEVVAVGHTHGDLTVDMAAPQSIAQMFEQVGSFDALVSTAGNAAFKPLTELSDADFEFSLSHKLMGQINLIRLGRARITSGGSFTLTSGVLASEPIAGASAISLVNAGLEGFGRAAALELKGQARVNVVSPPWVSETLISMGQSGAGGMPAADVARAYIASVEGSATGEILDARRFKAA